MQTRKLTEVPKVEFAKEAAFIVEIDEEIKRVPSSEVRRLIEAETGRAEAAEQMLSNRLVAETARAQAAEGALEEKLSAETKRAQAAEMANTANLQAEVERAEKAEQKLTADLTAECARALEAEGILASGLTSEAERAVEAETEITDRLEQEVLRAEAAEQANADALSKETVRAESRENEILTSLAEEIVRAQEAEKEIRGELYTETARAGAADQALSDRIDEEASRAAAAEKANSDAIMAETGRAEARESELLGNLDAHKAEVGGELQSLKAADTALDEKKADAADVNRELGDRYTKNQVFTKEEVLQKIEDLIGSAPDTHTHENKIVLDKITQVMLDKLATFSGNVSDLTGILPISKGGTGATTAEAARTALGAAAASHTHTAGQIVQDATHRFATDAEKTNWNKTLFSAAISVPASGWSASAPFTQTISVAGLTAAMDVVPVLNIAGSSTAAQVAAWKKALGRIDSGTTANGSVTFRCYGKKPAVDLPLYLKSV